MAVEQESRTASVFTQPSETPELSIVVPAFNEAPNLVPLVEEIVGELDDGPFAAAYEILLIDDGSTDETAEKIRHLASLFPQVRGIVLSRNFGQSAALAAGFDHAEGAVIVPMDADRQHDPADIVPLVEQLREGADCVSGWRLDRQDPLRKRIPSAIQTHLAQLTGPSIHDFGCTLTAYDAEALAEIDLRGEGHRYLPTRLHTAGFDVEERVVSHRERAAGDSKYGLGRLLRGGVDLAYHLFWGRYQDRPMHIFGGIGVVLFLLGTLLGSGLVVQNYLFSVDLLPNLPQLILAVSLTGFGFGLFAFGVIAELLTDLRFQETRPYRVGELVE